jgi:nitroreductase
MSLKQPLRDTVTVIMNCRSVRDFTGADIEKEALDTILRAGMSAPTAVNMQPWSFVVVTGRNTLSRISKGLPYACMLDMAGAAIVVCALPDKAFEVRLELAIIDCTCASENILLAAEALGLGAVWVAAYPYADRMALLRNTLNIPEKVIPLNVIPVGVPVGTEKPIDKYRAEKIHWEAW